LFLDATEFKRASHAVWEAMAPGWDERHAYMETTARPVTQRLLDSLEARPGQTILELAAGTGVVGFTALTALGDATRLIVSDFAGAMVEAARRHGDELGLGRVEYRVLDAEALDLPDESVDRVLCRWGYMLMADPGAALSETRRVLRRDGRVSCAVFAGPAENPWAALPMSALVESGNVPAPQSGQPGILALADTARLRQLFTGAGLTEPQIDEVAFAFPFADEEDYWHFLQGVAGAISMVLGRLGDRERDDVRATLAKRLEAYRTADGLELPAVSLVVAAARA
jgi:ubiquinone/menaquinone biosynthesis C-methylase UbiE